MLTRQMLKDAQSEIERRIELRMREEAGRLPDHALASGQYLDHPDYKQRGLYGTAATIHILARRATTDPVVKDRISKLLYYVVNRGQVEKASVSGVVYRDLVARRVRLQKSDVFRMADIGFAISQVSPVVPLRSEALTLVHQALEDARTEPAGYAVGSEGGSPNPLATAHALRCLAANNLPARPEDWRYLREYVSGGSDIYVRCFALSVLATYDPELERRELQLCWKEMFSALAGEFGGQSEANHEYTRYGAQDYVRVPWQLYLIQSCARLFPLTRFVGFSVQAKMMDVAQQISAPDGFKYEASGGHLSTRTYACVWQAIDEILTFNFKQPLPRVFVRTVSGATRVFSSQLFGALTYTILVAVAVGSLIEWLNTPGHSYGDLAPNLLVEVMLVILAGLRHQVRRRGHRR
ncbi:hypothetical protein LDL08_32345 [Nonomuraea glycinis]|uniref:Uncharacterized protein n=1 Tax=Nonomuraea glycinis TaxID=2047744 RepID=A0A918E9A1_9ACTN|nr:hypothetical protein [Nonomuraea glycinis]MCA2180880.1 hypothetical protein [Nonomuraea glycinis]GGP12936.1 hypothetical protein GCM10012278_62710 [Nonomuraea glycinis]